jgi:hypothetical protein
VPDEDRQRGPLELEALARGLAECLDAYVDAHYGVGSWPPPRRVGELLRQARMAGILAR